MKRVKPLINLCLIMAMVTAVLINRDNSRAYARSETSPLSMVGELEPYLEEVVLSAGVLADLGFKEATSKLIGEYVWKLSNGITVYSSVPYGGGIKGFAGATPLYIAVDNRQRIISIAADENQETPEFWYMAVGGELLKSWDGMTLREVASRQVDAVSGATMSSKGVIATVQETVAGILAQ